MTEQQKTLEPTADYRHGVDVATMVVFRMLRHIELPESVVCAFALALGEIREKRPLFGAYPEITDVEAEAYQNEAEERFAKARS